MRLPGIGLFIFLLAGCVTASNVTKPISGTELVALVKNTCVASGPSLQNLEATLNAQGYALKVTRANPFTKTTGSSQSIKRFVSATGHSLSVTRYAKSDGATQCHIGATSSVGGPELVGALKATTNLPVYPFTGGLRPTNRPSPHIVVSGPYGTAGRHVYQIFVVWNDRTPGLFTHVPFR